MTGFDQVGIAGALKTPLPDAYAGSEKSLSSQVTSRQLGEVCGRSAPRKERLEPD